jgi:hypothetical protein
MRGPHKELACSASGLCYDAPTLKRETSVRYTVHSYQSCSFGRLAQVCDSVPNCNGIPQHTLQSRGYSLGEAEVLASWLESRATGYTAPDAYPIRGMAA